MKNIQAAVHLIGPGLRGCLLLFVFMLPQTLLGQVVTSIQRITYGSPLIDSLPKNQFPRGGTYTAIVGGSGLAHVNGFIVPGIPAITGTITAASDAAVLIQLSSTYVNENDTANAPIHVVDFALLTTTGSIGAHVAFDIVADPGPQVTSWKFGSPILKWIPGGVKATLTYLADVASFGNVRFFYVGCFVCQGISIKSWTSTGDQFTTHWTVVIDVTPTTDFGTTNFPYIYGAVDGAGQGGLNGTDPLSPSKPLNMPIVQTQLVDPVPTLLSGPAVTGDSTLLGNQGLGTIVNGVAADGVAQVVIRIAGAPPNETFSLGPSQDGTLANIGSTSFQASIPVQADSSGNAYALYRAPLDFARPGGIDDAAASRIVDLTFQSSDNPGIVGDTKITVVRPPIVLVHGNWSNAPKDWQFFRFANSSAVPNLFTVDYSAVLAQGVIAASNYVLPQVQNTIQAFKSAAPTASGTTVPVAAVQADLVAYSLGGLVSRALVTLQPFVTSSNYGSGYVHKLITLDTPHQGAELAANLLSSSSTCHALFTAFVGPVQQNVHDMAPGSVLLRGLATPRLGVHLPTSVIVSIANSQQQFEANIAYSPSIISDLCPSLLPPGGYQMLFTTATNPTGNSDLIVSAYSQLATNLGVLGSIPFMAFSNVIHDANPILFPVGPDVRQISLALGVFSLNYVGVPPPFPSTERVFQLLNTPISQFGRIAP